METFSCENIKLEINKQNFNPIFYNEKIHKEVEKIKFLEKELIDEKLKLINMAENDIKTKLEKLFNIKISSLEFYEFIFKRHQKCWECYCNFCFLVIENNGYIIPFDSQCFDLENDIIKWFKFNTNYEKIWMVSECIGFKSEIPENKINTLIPIGKYIMENYAYVGYRKVLI